MCPRTKQVDGKQQCFDTLACHLQSIESSKRLPKITKPNLPMRVRTNGRLLPGEHRFTDGGELEMKHYH